MTAPPAPDSRENPKPESKPEIRHIYAKNAGEWRDWLRKNHKREARVFLVYYKKATGIPSVTYREALMEAICFGWIDTTVKRVDDGRYGTNFVKRGKNARWSPNTLSYAREMIRQKKMAKQGLEAFERAKNKPPLAPIPKDTPPAADLLKALRQNPEARAFFDKLPPSARLIYVAWVEKAARPETRQKRIAEVAARCGRRKKWGE